MSGMGLKSVSTVAKHVDNLCSLGVLRRAENEVRAIEVCEGNEHHRWFLEKYAQCKAAGDEDVLKAAKKTAEAFGVELD